MGQIDFNAALVLVRVVQVGSFRGAAKLLGMPKTSVSRKVAELEERLGAQLLNRTTRKLSLTDAGAAFTEQAEGAIARLEAAEHAVSELQRVPRGRLRVTATVMLGQQLLAPVLADFLDAYPAVELTVQLTDRHVDLVAERFDLAFRTGALPDSSLVTVPIGAASWRLVASPRYLASHGTPQRPTDLASHQCLLFARTGSAVRGAWPLGKGKRSREVSVTGRLVADDMVVLREAAVRGLGIARLPDMLVEAAIDRGDLVAVLDDAAPSPTPLQIVHLGGRNMPPRTRAFIEFVRPRLARLIAGGAAA